MGLPPSFISISENASSNPGLSGTTSEAENWGAAAPGGGAGAWAAAPVAMAARMTVREVRVFMGRASYNARHGCRSGERRKPAADRVLRHAARLAHRAAVRLCGVWRGVHTCRGFLEPRRGSHRAQGHHGNGKARKPPAPRV